MCVRTACCHPILASIETTVNRKAVPVSSHRLVREGAEALLMLNIHVIDERRLILDLHHPADDPGQLRIIQVRCPSFLRFVDSAPHPLLLLCVVLGPLLLFVPQIAEAKLIGLREYGALAQRYVRQFDSKWLRGGNSSDEKPLLGSVDIQSLADLSNSFDIVKSMNVAPFTKETVLQVGIMAVVPIAPLVLTLIPLEELLKRLFTILL